MKPTQRILSIISILSLAVFANCGGDGGNDTAPEKVQLGKLVKTWKLQSIAASSLSATLGTPPESAVAPSGQIHTDFTLTISGTFNSSSPEGPYTFSVSGTDTPSPWPPTGEWSFGSEPTTMLVRGDGIGIIYNINSAGVLTLEFNCSSCNYDGAARTSSVNGKWIFTLIPQ